MIEVRQLSVKKGGKQILTAVNACLRPGRITVLAGQNGAGKSTLLQAITTGKAPKSGQINWDGQAIQHLSARELACRRAVLAQQQQAGFAIKVHELIQMGTYASPKPLAQPDIQGLIRKALRQVQLEAFENRVLNTLSGGEQKRAWLAKCMVQLWCAASDDYHQYLFLDEPSASLDLHQQLHLLTLIKQMVDTRHIGVMAILHDINLAAQIADEIILLKDGKVFAAGSPEAIIQPHILAEGLTLNSSVYLHPQTGKPQITPLYQLKQTKTSNVNKLLAI